eukprot:gene11800-16077_t
MDTTSTSQAAADEVDDDGLAETDPTGRFLRYKEIVGRGRFKEVYKAFDTSIGIDVAWCKISGGSNPSIDDEKLAAAAIEIEKGFGLEHPNIIKVFKCWEDKEAKCINLISELFTSGNLRQYRTLHKHLDLKAVKRMAKQILKGLEYLHSMHPPITHGDLRCDKIYVNGHLGEMKIGDLGLATLMPYRWEGDENNPCVPEMNESADVFAFGLCLLELLTLKQLDPQHCSDWESHLEEVPDEDSRTFIAKCLCPERPSASRLIEDEYLSLKKPTSSQVDFQKFSRKTSEVGFEEKGSGHGRQFDLLVSNRSLHDAIAHEKRLAEEGVDDSTAPIAVGKLRGEDYNFEFAGKLKDDKMHFRLVMTQAVVDATEAQPFMRTIDFVFYPETDTADDLASEISEEFNLSPTDTEICAAALRELLAKEMPDGSK